ncbi:MAG: hypothetical protein ABUL69_01880, partial [Peristeroidobacter soli]
MESFSVRAHLTVDDWRALLMASGARRTEHRKANASLVAHFAPTILWLALGAVAVIMLTREPPLIRPWGVLVAFASYCAFSFALSRLQLGNYAPDKHGAFLGTTEFEFRPDGFLTRRLNSVDSCLWSLVKEISNTDDHVFLWIDTSTAFVIPARDLPAPMTPPTAVARLRELMAAAPPVADTASASTPHASVPAVAVPPPQAEPVATVLPSIAQELSALLRLYFWPRVDGTHLHGRDVTLILLGVFSFVLWAGLDRLNFEGEVRLFWYPINEVGVLVLAVLLLAWLMSRLSRPRIEMRRALLVLLGFLPLFIVGIWFAFTLSRIGVIAVFMIFFAWMADRYLVAGMRSMTGKPQQLAASAALATTLLLFYLSTQIYFSPSIWFSPEEDGEDTVETTRAHEQLVFDQPLRIAADIEKLAPGEAGKANAWFVGLAGYGDQRVFAE